MKAVLTIDYDSRIMELFAPEDKDMKRASYTVSENTESIVFTAKAQDATAMRAVLNSITKTLALWERSKDI